MAGRPTETLHRWVPRLTLSKFTWNRLVPPLKTEAPAWRPSAVAGRQTHASLGSGWEELWVPAVTSREPLPHLGAAHPGRVWRRADWLGALWAPTCGVGPSGSLLTHSGRAHSARVGCDVTKLDYFKGTALDVGGCQRLVPYLCSPNSLCASPGSNPNPGHPPPPPNPGSKGVLGGSVSNFCFAARISNARSFSNPPRAVSRGCSQLCDPEIVSVGAVLGEAWRVRGASQTLAPYAVRALSSLRSRALTACKVGGREAPPSDALRGPPRGGGRAAALRLAAGGDLGPALSAGLPASKVLCTKAPPRCFNADDFFFKSLLI